MASTVDIVASCDGAQVSLSIHATHKDWGSWVEVQVDGETIRLDRPAGHDEYTGGSWSENGHWSSDDVGGGSFVWFDDSYGDVRSDAHYGTFTVPVCDAGEAPTTTVDVCHEDEDCWDCTTMGNLICGPTTTLPQVTVPVEATVVETTVAVGDTSTIPLPLLVVDSTVVPPTVAVTVATTAQPVTYNTLAATGAASTAAFVSGGVGFLLLGALALKVARRDS